MVFKIGLINIQAAGYSSTCTVLKMDSNCLFWMHPSSPFRVDINPKNTQVFSSFQIVFQ